MTQQQSIVDDKGIERTVQSAIFIDDDFNPVDKSEATMVEVIFTDGSHLWGKVAEEASSMS